MNKKNTLELFKRVTNNKMIEEKDEKGNIITSDSADIKAICKRIFGDGIENGDPSLINQFNNLITITADEVANRMLPDIISLMADYEREDNGNIRQIKIPKKVRAKFAWSASNSGVILTNVSKQRTVTAVPQTFKTGFSYNPNDFNGDTVMAFNDLVNNLAEAKLRLYMAKFYELTTAGVTSGAIPTSNVVDASGASITQYNKLASNIQRVGNSRPIFLADTLMIDNFIDKSVADANISKLFSDETKDMLYRELYYERIGRTDAFNIINPFLDDDNDSVELPVNKGFMLSSGISKKPFTVVEYGGMRQRTQQEFETEEIQMIITFSASMLLLHGDALGYIKDDSIVL